jgi:hypothetical protein
MTNKTQQIYGTLHRYLRHTGLTAEAIIKTLDGEISCMEETKAEHLENRDNFTQNDLNICVERDKLIEKKKKHKQRMIDFIRSGR